MRTRTRAAAIACAGVGLLLVACASLAPSVEPRRIRALRLSVPETHVCPGQTIRATYAAVMDDGSTRALEGSALALLTRRGDAAEPAERGEWSSDPDPLVSAMTGFRLSVWLTANPAVAAETTVAPAYSCSPRRFTFVGTARDRDGPEVTVRTARMRSPFYDSLVVVVVETPDSRPLHALFRQADLAPHTIRIESGGRAGNPGADGREARSTPECTDGEDGTDGQEGGRGGDGGQITVIGDADNPWLQDLFELASTGGAAGAGGMGGRGGPPGIRRPGPDGVLCPQPRGGRNGRRGANGLPGVGGPAPKRLDSSLSLMWFGSQSYEDPKTSKVLSAMLNYTLHPRP